ncbi:MAG: sugar ABC transporter permease [Thermotogae bacterium]|uniref:carbohydrate ABC transporter permease n=1 Tax=Kosmotoga sp. TaxID=1955248 RepID=UPI000F280916|nr:sugar ABC transporter permease [Kosmotoga sp.]MBO8167445.1 sugar ABC transporter permease [Kosmotoga sp.]MCD6159790.1 sugar ABC transporter permease [Kosmotoga sp.]RKX48039.1 MAG: sugar ABC transporter permease [Thermotogota bacterium]
MKLAKRYLLLFVLPALILYTLFIVYPLINSLFLSLYSWPGVGKKTFVGLDNFRKVFSAGSFRNEVFNAFWHNVYFYFLAALIEIGVGFFIALMLASKIKGARMFRNIVYIPNMIPLVLVGFMWSLYLNPQVGLVNQFLKLIGLGGLAQSWLGQESTALTTIILVNAWRNIGFYVLVLLAAILDINPSLLEAAYIDGASNWKIIWRIIFPLSFSTVRTLAILLFIWSFNVFDMIYALEGVQAGPYRSTDVLGTLFYRTAFGGLGSSAIDMGLGATITVFIFAIIMPVSILYVYLVEKRQRSA